MSEPKEEEPLTQKEKNAIRSAIINSMNPDDKDPDEVIEEQFNGDEEAYFRVMARWHHVPIGSDSGND